ncbi:predicted protein [Botrytis cinerea T4]|uniref:Uncharacterized protein n=1 Tax=Botryotinia fuckeliana (strain T4) TaxID=999810 RepID=G2XZ22_BOTF4|nr:predicted protein [Botrytis cinerea T4]
MNVRTKSQTLTTPLLFSFPDSAFIVSPCVSHMVRFRRRQNSIVAVPNNY